MRFQWQTVHLCPQSQTLTLATYYPQLQHSCRPFSWLPLAVPFFTEQNGVCNAPTLLSGPWSTVPFISFQLSSFHVSSVAFSLVQFSLQGMVMTSMVSQASRISWRFDIRNCDSVFPFHFAFPHRSRDRWNRKAVETSPHTWCDRSISMIAFHSS